MPVKVYIIEDGLAMSYMNDINSFREFLSTDEILNLAGPKLFETEAEAEAFCISLNEDKNYDEEPYTEFLRSYVPTDAPFIQAIENC